MTNEKLTELLKIAYRWGRDNGEGRSEKNFNDLLDTKAVNEALRNPSGIRLSEPCDCGNPNPPCAPNLKFGMLECCECDWGE
jgi:hypothetical protein